MWDDVLYYAEQAGEFQRENYRTLLDIAAAATGDKAYKQLRRELSGKGKAKEYKPLTEAEAVGKLKNGV